MTSLRQIEANRRNALKRLEKAFSVVKADRPEAIDGHIFHVELVDRLAIVLARRDVEIDGVLIGIEAPARRGDGEVPDRIDLVPAASRAAPIRDGFAEHHQRLANLLVAGRVPVCHLVFARAARLLDLDRILQGVDLRCVLWIVRVGQDADRRRDVACTDVRFAESMTAGPIVSRTRVACLGAVRIDDYKYRFIDQPGGWQGDKTKPDVPYLINLRLDPFERTGWPDSGTKIGSQQYFDWFKYEFWRFVFVQQQVEKLAMTAVEFPPMQKGASFNLDAVKAKIEAARTAMSK